jgi:adenylate cyclase
MAEEGFKRKLAAILSADVEGYSRLMDDDEEATLRTLTTYRTAMSDLVQQYRGRVVDTTGDNLMAEFTSVVDSVNCAVEIQRELAERNTELPYNRKMEFRIGINLGDVIEEEGRIYGDGVNIAARVEALAKTGGICISGRAYDQVENKLGLEYENLGEHQVKNITRPIRVYRVLSFPGAAAHRVVKAKEMVGKKWRKIALSIAAVVAVAVVVGVWQFYMRRPTVEPASMDKMAFQLPEKPSIAVLPFDNLSGDPEQEYFSDGITNDIITDLSKFGQLFVIASNTVFAYKGKPVKVKDVSQELGVRYILEGCVQRASGRVRINAQLIDASTGHYLWAERYHRSLKDLFDVQDEIVQTIVATLAVKLTRLEQQRAFDRPTGNLEAYDYMLRGWQYESRSTRSANFEARQMFQRAIELDPRYGSAYVGLGKTYRNASLSGWTEFPGQALEQAHDLAQKAMSLDESNAAAHALLGEVYTSWRQYDLAIRELERAIELNPNDWNSHVARGVVMLWSSRSDEAIHSLETALRFNPNMNSIKLMPLGLAYYLKERYDESIRTLERIVAREPDHVWTHIVLAAAYSQVGRTEDAGRAATTVLRLSPFFEVDLFGTAFRNPADRARITQGLRKAGLK